MRYKVVVNGDGESYWNAYNDFQDAWAEFLESLVVGSGRKVTLEWIDKNYEEE